MMLFRAGQRAAAAHYDCQGTTHPGNRRPCNEDAVMSREDVGLWAVADGMGGHSAGDVASKAICDALQSVRLTGSLASRVDQVEDTLLHVNDALRIHGEQECDGATVGSTVVALMLEQETGVVLWAGDSRLYRRRGSELDQITRDHNPVCDLLDSGAVSESQALAADTNVITRAVGGQSGLTLDVALFDVRPEDTYMLCTDGLYRELDDAQLGSALRLDELAVASEWLLQRTLAGEARDNVSFMLVRKQG
ncbi:MAG: PP2C family serine/threonine-protein phosphatase [Pseudomonadales bacterium]